MPISAELTSSRSCELVMLPFPLKNLSCAGGNKLFN